MASFPCLAFFLPFFYLVWADINPSQEADINPSQEADINPSQEADINPSQEADFNPSQEAYINPSQERFLNFSFVPPSPHLLAAVGACQGGRCFYLLLGPIFQDIRKELSTLFVKSKSIHLQVPGPHWWRHLVSKFPIELSGQGQCDISARNLQRLPNSP